MRKVSIKLLTDAIRVNCPAHFSKWFWFPMWILTKPQGLWRCIQGLRRIVSLSVLKLFSKKEQKRVYTFRHSFATHLLKAGYDIRMVQELLWDKDVKTMIYMHVLNQDGKGVLSPLAP